MHGQIIGMIITYAVQKLQSRVLRGIGANTLKLIAESTGFSQLAVKKEENKSEEIVKMIGKT